MSAKVKRSEFITFINVTPSTAATYQLIGEGVTSGSIAYNPEVEEEIYIHQDSGVTDVTGYKPSMKLEATAIAGNAVFDFIDGLRINRAIMSAAVTDIVNVWAYKTATEGAYPAEKQAVSVAFEEFGGEGGKKAKLPYTLHFQGDPVKGSFNPSTKAFTAA